MQRRRSSERRNRWILALIRPLAPASLSLLYAILYLFMQRNPMVDQQQRDNDDTNDTDDNNNEQEDSQWWQSITSIPKNDNDILLFLLLWFFLSYSALQLLVYNTNYHSILARLCPHHLRSTNNKTTPFGTNTTKRVGRVRQDERMWYHWTSSQFLDWVLLDCLAVGTTSVGVTSSTSTNRTESSPYNHYEIDDSDDDDIEEEDWSKRIYKHLLPHRINGAILPYLAVSDYCQMMGGNNGIGEGGGGAAYGDALSLHIRVEELMQRHPMPGYVMSATTAAMSARNRNGVPIGGDSDGDVGGDAGGGGGGSNGIDLQGWLSGKSISESRQRRPSDDVVVNQMEKAIGGRGGGIHSDYLNPIPSIGGGGAGGAGDDVEHMGGMERVQEIMSERFGIQLPQLNTDAVAAAANKKRTTISAAHPPPPSVSAEMQPPSSSTIQYQPVVEMSQSPPPSHQLLDSMPANIREIASRRPDLVNTIIQQQQQQRQGQLQPPPPLHQQQASKKMEEDNNRKMSHSFFQSRKGDGYLDRLEEDEEEAEEADDVVVNSCQDLHDDGDEMVGLLRKRRVKSSQL